MLAERAPGHCIGLGQFLALEVALGCSDVATWRQRQRNDLRRLLGADAGGDVAGRYFGKRRLGLRAGRNRVGTAGGENGSR